MLKSLPNPNGSVIFASVKGKQPTYKIRKTQNVKNLHNPKNNLIFANVKLKQSIN